MHSVAGTFVLNLLFALVSLTFAHAQTSPPSVAQDEFSEEAFKEKKNAWTVGVLTGQLGGTYPRFGQELSKVLDDGDTLRVIPLLSNGAAANLEDLLYLKGVDVAITQSDVFEHFLKKRNIPNLKQRVHFILRLYDAETHILARTEIRNLHELRGKKVVFGPPGNAATLTGPILFERLGIEPITPLFVDHATGFEMLKSGEAAALVRVVGKPIEFFSNMPAESGFHFLSVPFTENMGKLEDYYSLAELTHEDYPRLIPAGKTLETISVPNVLAAYNWSKDSDRHQRVSRFTEALFAKWDRFKQPQFHPKWRDINLAATVPGWTRLEAAERMLKRIAAEPRVEPAEETLRSEFKQFLQGSQRVPRTRDHEDDLFREFLDWRRQTKQSKR